MKRTLLTAAVLTAFAAAAIAANLLVTRGARNKIYSDVHVIPHRHVGLVLGCPKRVSDGRLNLFFQNRMRAAVQLYNNGKVDYLLVSGDGENHTRGGDEPTDMKNALIAGGVPADKIYPDYAGFRTLDSVVRAKKVFGQSEVTIISQQWQDQRAIFIADHRGVDAIAFRAPEVWSRPARIREYLARVKAVLDIYVFRLQPRLLGQKVAIENIAQGFSPGVHRWRPLC